MFNIICGFPCKLRPEITSHPPPPLDCAAKAKDLLSSNDQQYACV